MRNFSSTCISQLLNFVWGRKAWTVIMNWSMKTLTFDRCLETLTLEVNIKEWTDISGVMFMVRVFNAPFNNISVIWGRCNLKRSRRIVIFLPVYKISSLKITPPKTPNSGQFSYLLPNIVSFLFEKKSTRVPV